MALRLGAKPAQFHFSQRGSDEEAPVKLQVTDQLQGNKQRSDSTEASIQFMARKGQIFLIAIIE